MKTKIVSEKRKHAPRSSLEEINTVRREVGYPPLQQLPSLAEHCGACGVSLSHTIELVGGGSFSSLDGGRCLVCMTAVCAILPGEDE